MMTVRQASFRGIHDRGGGPLAEVEVHTDDPVTPSLLAYFRKGPKGYQLVRVLSNDADKEVDWFDNGQHEAFQDVTMKIFNGPSHAGTTDRKEFAAQVLETGGVRADLDLHLGQGGG